MSITVSTLIIPTSTIRQLYIIIINLTSVCPCLHGLDGSPKCHLSTMCDLAHLPASASTSLYHSSVTHSFQVFLPLPIPLFPASSIFLHADTQSYVSLRFTC